MRRYRLILPSLLFILALYAVFYPFPASAATMTFVNRHLSVKKSATFSMSIDIGTDKKTITGADVWVSYDPDMLEFVSVKDSKFFPYFSSKTNKGSLHISGVVTDLQNVKRGSGEVAVLTFKTLKAGDTYLHFECRNGASDSSKIILSDLDATNIIDCDILRDSQITITDTGILSTISRLLFDWWK